MAAEAARRPARGIHPQPPLPTPGKRTRDPLGHAAAARVHGGVQRQRGGAEVVGHLGAVAPEVHHAPAQHQQQAVEEVEGVGRGRVDGGADGHPRGGQRLDHGHDLVGGERVQARGLQCEKKNRAVSGHVGGVDGHEVGWLCKNREKSVRKNAWGAEGPGTRLWHRNRRGLRSPARPGRAPRGWR